MLDDFRRQGSSFVDEEEAPELIEKRRQRPFLGLTPVQRFMLAAMLLVLVCVIGAFMLLVTEKIVPPFIY